MAIAFLRVIPSEDLLALKASLTRLRRLAPQRMRKPGNPPALPHDITELVIPPVPGELEAAS
jgi:hypothetical protein